MITTFLILYLIFLNFSNTNSDTIINIERFGAFGNDINDDTNQFDAAVEYISRNGGILYVPKGEYILDNNNRNRSGLYGHSYIFVISNNIEIILDKEAVLRYKNGFKGYRFRSVTDPTEKTVNRYSVKISGGIINGLHNFNKKVSNNPEMWGFVGETLNNFTVTDLRIENFYGTAGLASYSNNFTEINDIRMYNVTGNPFNLTDNHGDGIYIANTKNYMINNNVIINNIEERRIGRIGICIEYEISEDGRIFSNEICGYDRGIHIELTKGTSNIINNNLHGNSSGIVLWNNHGYGQIIDNNNITNEGLPKNNISLLYTSAPILLLEYNSNNGTIIKNNRIEIREDFFIPNNLTQITSSNLLIAKNIFADKSNTLSLSVAQGRSNEKRVRNIIFKENDVSCNALYVYDGTNIGVDDNILNVDIITLSFDDSNNSFKRNRINKKSTILKLFGKNLL